MYITQCILNRDLKHLFISINQDSAITPNRVLFYADRKYDSSFSNWNAYIPWNTGTEMNIDLEDLIYNQSFKSNIDFGKSFIFVVLEYTENEKTKHIFTTVFNVYRIYDFFINCIKELDTDKNSFDSKCNDSAKNFIDTYLRFKAIDIAIKTNHYEIALDYYNKFFNRDLKTSKCRCNG